MEDVHVTITMIIMWYYKLSVDDRCTITNYFFH